MWVCWADGVQYQAQLSITTCWRVLISLHRLRHSHILSLRIFFHRRCKESCSMTRSNRRWGAGLVCRWKEYIKLYGSHLYGIIFSCGSHHRSTRPQLQSVFHIAVPLLLWRLLFLEYIYRHSDQYQQFSPFKDSRKYGFYSQWRSQHNQGKSIPITNSYPRKSSTPALVYLYGSSFSMVACSSLARPDQTWSSYGMRWAYFAWLFDPDHQEGLAPQWATWPFQCHGLLVISFISTFRMRCQAYGCFDLELCRTHVEVFGGESQNQ